MTVSDGWVTGITPGHRTKTIRVGNCIVEINRPILTEEEMREREEEVIHALRSFIRKEN